MFKEVENFISKAECNDLIAFCKDLQPEQTQYVTDHYLINGELGTVGELDEKVVKGEFFDLPFEHPMNEKLWPIAEEFARDNNYNMNISTGSSIIRYQQGGHYAWHTDGFNETDRFTLSIQLSDLDDYEGGEVQFGEDTQGSNRTTSQDIYHDWDLTQSSIKPVHTLSKNIGSICLYDAFIYHKVTPLTKGTRYVLLSWFRYYASII